MRKLQAVACCSVWGHRCGGAERACGESSPCSLLAMSGGITVLCRCQAADLSKNGIGVKGTTALVEALQQNEALQTLILDTNSIGDDGAEILAKHLSSVHLHALLMLTQLSQETVNLSSLGTNSLRIESR